MMLSRKNYILFAALVTTCGLSAQKLPLDSANTGSTLTKPTTTQSSLEINTTASFYSAQVPGVALYRVMGGSFSNKIISKTSDLIGNGVGRVQGETSIGVLFNDYSGSVIPRKNGWWTLNYGFTNLYGARFNRDAFNLVFRGNAPYAGTTLRSKQLELNSMSWNSLGASYTKPLKQSVGTYSNLSVGASWVFMRDYSRISIPEASLFTSGLGDSLHLAYSLDCTRKDKNKLGFYPLSHGASINLRYWAMKKLQGRSIYWYASVNDLGLVSLGSAASRYSKDSAIGINGWEVPFTPYGIDSNASFSNYFDTLLHRLNPQRTPQNMFVAMPALFQCFASVNYSNGHRVFGRLTYRSFPGFIPRATIGYEKFHPKYSYGAQLSCGGVNSGDIGAFASWKPMNSLYVKLELNALEGLVLPYQAGGAGGRVMLVWSL